MLKILALKTLSENVSDWKDSFLFFELWKGRLLEIEGATGADPCEPWNSRFDARAVASCNSSKTTFCCVGSSSRKLSDSWLITAFYFKFYFNQNSINNNLKFQISYLSQAIVLKKKINFLFCDEIFRHLNSRSLHQKRNRLISKIIWLKKISSSR